MENTSHAVENLYKIMQLLHLINKLKSISAKKLKKLKKKLKIMGTNCIDQSNNEKIE